MGSFRKFLAGAGGVSRSAPSYPGHDEPLGAAIYPKRGLHLRAMGARFFAIFFPFVLAAQVASLPPLRQQAEIQQEWLRLRLERHLPALMRKHGVQMWIVACREYAEDPAFFSLVSPTVFAARRTTVYVFFDRGISQPLERLALGGDSQRRALYEVYLRSRCCQPRDIHGDNQWQLLRKLVDQRQFPRTSRSMFRRRTRFRTGLTSRHAA